MSSAIGLYSTSTEARGHRAACIQGSLVSQSSAAARGGVGAGAAAQWTHGGAAAGEILPLPILPYRRVKIQANCETHRPQKLKCLISLCTNPVSILSVPIQTVR